MSEIVTDKEVELALDYLRDEARPAAKAVAESAYMGEFRKSLKAQLMGDCNETTAAQQERYAYAHDDYKAHLRAMQTAIEKAKEHEFLLKAASVKIDVWKAEQFRHRAMEKIQ
jgi:hypothetical protein